MAAETDVAHGPGPDWLRYLLVVVAALYDCGLAREPVCHVLHRPVAEHTGWTGVPIFFTQASSLFPNADRLALEARLDAWSCERNAWEPLDPRPYFPMETANKESRFQRLAYFYPRGPGDRVVMHALDDFIRAKHPTVDDGVSGKIGGIRLYYWEQQLPAPGQPPLHYEFDPKRSIPEAERKLKFNTVLADRKARCGTT